MGFEANSEEVKAIHELQSAGRRIVFTNGCFDILHVGHVRYLSDARKLGDVLVIGLNSDESVRQLKGSPRPYVSESERKEMLLALRCVDFVLGYSEETPLNLITTVQPDVLVKGGDWPVSKIVGADVVFAKGGQVLSLPFTAARSTTALVEKIQNHGE